MRKIQIPKLMLCFFIVISTFYSTGCGILKPIPDNCDPKSACILDSCKNTLPVSLSLGKPNTVDICACKPWNRSKIMVKKGEVYKFEFKLEEVDDWVDGKTSSTPNRGWREFLPNVMGTLGGFYKRSDQANWYALIGSIGRDEEKTFAIFDDSKNTPVSEKTMDDDGELYIFANDMWGRYGNNRGTLKLSITLIKQAK